MQSKIISPSPLAHTPSTVTAGENNYLLNGIANNVNCVDFLNDVSFLIEPAADTVGKRMLLSENMQATTKDAGDQ